MALLDELLASAGMNNSLPAPLGMPAPSAPVGLDQILRQQAPPMNVQPPPQEKPKQSPREVMKGFMGDFLFTLGEAFKARSQYRGPQGTAAGMGAAFQAPMLLESIKQKQAQEQAQLQQEAAYKQAQMQRMSAQSANEMLQNAIEMRRNELAANKPPAERNIDPLSPEGIAAAVDRQKQLDALKPADVPKDTRTEEEKFIDLALADAKSKKPDGKLNIAEEKSTRLQAKKDWAESGKNPQMEELLMRSRELNIQLQQDALNKKRSNELNANDNRRVDTEIARFNSNGIVKDYIDKQNKYEGMKSLISRGWTGPGDLALVYQFMKALDPSSVVRETEFDTAAKSGNVFTGWAAKFNGKLNPNGGFLSDDVKKEFLNIAKSQLDITGKQYQTVRKSAVAAINRIAKDNVGEDWLPNYGGSFEEPAMTSGEAPEGTIIVNDKGDKMVKRGGKWVKP